jgi:hypothetical protein
MLFALLGCWVVGSPLRSVVSRVSPLHSRATHNRVRAKFESQIMQVASTVAALDTESRSAQSSRPPRTKRPCKWEDQTTLVTASVTCKYVVLGTLSMESAFACVERSTQAQYICECNRTLARAHTCIHANYAAHSHAPKPNRGHVRSTKTAALSNIKNTALAPALCRMVASLAARRSFN